MKKNEILDLFKSPLNIMMEKAAKAEKTTAEFLNDGHPEEAYIHAAKAHGLREGVDWLKRIHHRIAAEAE